MDDKTFELMEKMYSEMLGMKQDISGVKQGQEKMHTDIIEMKQEIKQLEIKIEGEVIPKIEALFDGYKQNTDRIDSLENKIDDLRLDINSLSVKTINNDNRIIEITRNLRSVR